MTPKQKAEMCVAMKTAASLITNYSSDADLLGQLFTLLNQCLKYKRAELGILLPRRMKLINANSNECAKYIAELISNAAAEIKSRTDRTTEEMTRSMFAMRALVLEAEHINSKSDAVLRRLTELQGVENG